MLEKIKNKNAMQADIENQRRIMRNIEARETNPNEREVMEHREKARQKEIAEELKAWRQLDRNEYNRGTFLSKEYFFGGQGTLMKVGNQFANSRPSVLNCPNLEKNTPKMYGNKLTGGKFGKKK